MKKLFLLSILLSGVTLTAPAQKKLYLAQNPVWVEWADAPKTQPTPPEYATQPALVLLNETKIDYRLEGNDLVKHVTRHTITKVIDDRGIERYSTMYVPLTRGAKVTQIKVRTVSPSGKVYVLDKERVLQGQDGNYYTLVLPSEGVEKGSEIELLLKEVNPFDFNGTEMFQFDVPVFKTRFLLSYPKNMTIDVKSYNGFPQLTSEMHNTRMQYKLDMDNVPALLPERHSYYDVHRMQLSYRVSYFTRQEGEERLKINTYNALARKVWNESYKFSQREMDAVNKFLIELGVRDRDDEEKNIRKIELGIKNRITAYPYVNFEERREIGGVKELRSMSLYAPGYEDPREVLDTVLATKAASYKGYIRLFAACLTQAGIKHNIGWAWERGEQIINPAFETWYGLNHTLIYFPNQKKFLQPTDKFLRYPMTQSSLAGSKGVFCVIPPKGLLDGPMYKVRNITPMSEKETRSDVDATVSFDKKMNATVNMTHSWYGYSSVDLRTELPFTRPENMQKFVAGEIDFARTPQDVLTYKFANEDVSAYNTNKPLVLTATVNGNNLLNKAGSRYLLQVGKIIGKQNDVYQERPRNMPVELDYPFSGNHKIVINIPKGYKVANPDAVRISAEYLDREVESVISFQSGYKYVKDARNGDKLIVTVNEMFRQLKFGAAEYDRFKNVFNAAADFNNVTLVLVKK